MNKSRVAVIVPCYNAEKFLKDTIKSILSQSYKDIDLYLLNNGSTDNTHKIIESQKKKDNRIKIINHKNKTSRAKSVNSIIKKIPNKLVSLTDADDLMFKNKIKIQLDYLKKYPDIKFLSCLGTYITNGKKNYGRTINQLKNHNSCYELINDKRNIGLLTPGIIFYRNEFLKVGGFREEFWPCDDTDLWTRCAEQKYTVYAIPKILMKYRIHQNSITTSNFYFSRKKNEWVNDCLKRRLIGKKEISFKNFCINLNKRNIHKKIANLLDDNCDFYFRNIIIHIIENNFMKIFIFLMLSFIWNPIRFCSKVKKRFK